MRKTASMVVTMLAVVLVHSPAFASAICGDVDGTGTVTAADATLVNRYVAGLEPTLTTTGCRMSGILQCGDVNQDGYVGLDDWVAVQRAAQGVSSPCSVEGFAASTNRTASSSSLSYIPVTSIMDTTAPGTLRSALTLARNMGGGLITFDLTGANRTIVATSNLRVPPNTVIDGIGSQVTIDGTNIANNGVLNVFNSNIAIRHVRVRNAGVNGGVGTDGIQVAPKDINAAAGIQNIAIQHVSVTKSIDGGIDVTGCIGLSSSGCAGGTTSNVTLANNFLSANGSAAGGGANLTKYGVSNVTMVGNLWEKNLRRNPLLDNTESTFMSSLADVRFNLVRSPHESWVRSTGSGATMNVVNTCFEGSSQTNTIISLTSGGTVYVEGNLIPPGTTQVGGGTPSPTPFGPAPCVSSTNRNRVFGTAGAAPRDSVDLCFINAANYTQAWSCP